MATNNSGQFKKGIIPWNKKHSNVLRCILCNTIITTRGAKKYCSRKCFETTKFGNNNRLGKKFSVNTKKVISEKISKLWLDENYKKMMSDNHIGKMTGPDNSNWKGGISEIKKHWNKLRLQRMKEIKGFHSNSEWGLLKLKYNFQCVCCKKSEPEIKLTKDHIIPVSKGGSNNIENIQPLCRKCNSYKYNKVINYIDLEYGNK